MVQRIFFTASGMEAVGFERVERGGAGRSDHLLIEGKLRVKQGWKGNKKTR